MLAQEVSNARLSGASLLRQGSFNLLMFFLDVNGNDIARLLELIGAILSGLLSNLRLADHRCIVTIALGLTGCIAAMVHIDSGAG
jgi:hypothetical protein